MKNIYVRTISENGDIKIVSKNNTTLGKDLQNWMKNVNSKTRWI